MNFRKKLLISTRLYESDQIQIVLHIYTQK